MKTNIRSGKKMIRNSLLMFAAVLVAGSGVLGSPQVAAQAACGTTTSPPTTYGKATQTVNVATSGTYRVWSRIKAPNSTANSYYLQFDGGCAINVGDAAIPANTWTWVNYQGGSAANVINVTLSAGSHTLTYTGKEADVQIDRVLLLGNTSCTPTGNGDDCGNVDSVPPTVSLTSPAAGSSVTAGTPVTISATASDTVGVSKVEFYVDGAMVNSDATAPFTYNWPTTGAATGARSITARAHDAAGNATTSAARSITITGTTVPDTEQPTVSLAVASNQLPVGGTANLTATATDNKGVSKVEFYNGATLIGTDTTAPYNFAWNTAGQTSGTKSLTAKAYDAAGNTGTSAQVAVTLTGGTTTMPGDVDGDNRVNIYDLSVLITHDGENYPAADFNNDGVVGAADLAILLNRWTW